MANELKEIILKIACLPASSQRWIMRRLTNEQLELFNQHQGLKHLAEAKRFRKLKGYTPNPSIAAIGNSESTINLPVYCQTLLKKSPLYAAVVMEQGAYPWQALFLQQLDSEGLIKNALHNEVPDLKPLIKTALFNEWEDSISFKSYLELEHG